MKKHDNRHHILLRYLFVIALIIAFAAYIIYKLLDTTVVSVDKWNAMAMRELSRVDTIQPERGNILAEDGSILATNLRYYTLRMDYRSEKFGTDSLRKYAPAMADSLARRFRYLTAKQWRARLLDPLKLPREKRPRAMRLATGLSYTDVVWIKQLPFFKGRRSNFTGLVMESYMRRANPYGDMASRSIGRVGAKETCNEIHGISGLEMALDTLLYGKIGFAKPIPLTKGIVNWTNIPAVPGNNITTTIDINMQDIVENELNDLLQYCDADWGLAVLMDVKTGDIKAISNLEKCPGSDIYIEAYNRAVQRYEPGSVVKVLSMLVALEDGIVSDVNEVITTGNSYAYAGGRPITDAHPYPSMTVGDVIERSSNIGMTRIIARKYDSNPGAFYSRIKQLGFLKPLNTGIGGERTPRFDSVPNNKGGRIAMSRMCYGYATEIPPLYTLALYNAIANGGKFVRPRLVKRITGVEGDTLIPVSYVNPNLCTPVNAAKLRKMLKNVVFGKHGTARRLRNDVVPIAGKTGTCYMIESNGTYNTSRKRLTFCGFFPADEPRYSCIVLTANPKKNVMGAASTSGEVVKGIALKLYSRGMLGNTSDYTTVKNPGTRPTLYATHSPAHLEKLRDRVSLGTSSVMKQPAGNAARGKVPDVRGLGLREAIAVLEGAGYNVKFKGTGYVGSQSPAAGTAGKRGSTITLALYN